MVDKVLGQIVKSRAFITAYEAFKQLPLQDFAVLQVHFKKAERDNREWRDSGDQHGYGMGADENAANEMTKNLTELAQALRQNETENGASDATKNTSALEQIKKWNGQSPTAATDNTATTKSDGGQYAGASKPAFPNGHGNA